MRNQSLLAASILLAFGCASESMHSDSGELSAALADQRAETARHSDACEVAGSMSSVLDDLDRHVQAMDSMMLRMDAGMHEMSTCSISDSTRVSSSMSEARAELTDHRARLVSISELTAAHRECVRYAPMMEATLLSVSAGLEGMPCMTMNH